MRTVLDNIEIHDERELKEINEQVIKERDEEWLARQFRPVELKKKGRTKRDTTRG